MNSHECVQNPALIDRLAHRIESEMGLSFSSIKRRDLLEAIRCMAETNDFQSAESCMEWLLSGHWDKTKADLCALHLTIGETYFFREPRAFDLVRDYAVKKMLCSDESPRLRIWSAGCCTGEEPYSIAMTLMQSLPQTALDRTTILATDINSRHLQFARAGIYRQWSFRNTCVLAPSQYFSVYNEDRVKVSDEVRKTVTFAELNLAGATYPSVTNGTQAMDIIFCRNVLMYFSQEQAKKAIARFRQCLVEGGWLIVSPSEASSELFSGFVGTYYPDAIYFQKKSDMDAEDEDACRAASLSVPITSVIRHPSRAKLGPSRKVASVLISRQPKAIGHTGMEEEEPVSASRMLANQGRVAEALDYLDRAIDAGKHTAELYHAKALIAMESGDHQGAVQSLKRVLYLQPDFILARYLMGVLQSEQNRHGEAVKQFETAVELLDAVADDDIVPGSDGLHAAYLRELIRSSLRKEHR